MHPISRKDLVLILVFKKQVHYLILGYVVYDKMWHFVHPAKAFAMNLSQIKQCSRQSTGMGLKGLSDHHWTYATASSQPLPFSMPLFHLPPVVRFIYLRVACQGIDCLFVCVCTAPSTMEPHSQLQYQGTAVNKSFCVSDTSLWVHSLWGLWLQAHTWFWVESQDSCSVRLGYHIASCVYNDFSLKIQSLALFPFQESGTRVDTVVRQSSYNISLVYVCSRNKLFTEMISK